MEDFLYSKYRRDPPRLNPGPVAAVREVMATLPVIRSAGALSLTASFFGCRGNVATPGLLVLDDDKPAQKVSEETLKRFAFPCLFILQLHGRCLTVWWALDH